MIAILVLISLVLMAASGMRMGRLTTNFFRDLENIEPELWKELGKPTMKMFDPGGYFRSNQVLFKKNTLLDNHPEFASQYRLTRKWFLIFQSFGLLIFALFTISMITNNA